MDGGCLRARVVRDRPHGARPDAPADHLRLGTDAAVRAGDDTDTVAAIAGGLLGAAYGASAVPLEWRVRLHGWPGLRAHDLVNLASAIARGGKPDLFDFSYFDSPIDTVAVHPHDDKVLLGASGVARSPGRCRCGGLAVPAGR